MRFLLDSAGKDRELGISKDLVYELFTALANIHYKEQEDLVPVPEEEPDKEEQDPELEKKQEEAQNTNEEITARNEVCTKMKTFVRFVTPEEGESAEPNYEEWDEKCYIQLMNFREAVVGE